MSDDAPITIELNPRERRLWDRLRSRVAPVRSGGGSGFADVLLLLPDLTVLLARLLRDPRVPIGAKLIAVAGVGYVLLPFDLLPEILLGPVGLIDDLLIVGAALSGLLERVHPDIVRSHWSGQGDALDAIQRVTSWSRRQIGNPLRRLLDRVVFRGRARA
jgi:uncharacterized membrane protein YkvA (DUF1232 family)